MVDPAAKTDIVATGLLASPGGATGRSFSAEEAEEQAAQGLSVIPVRRRPPRGYPRHESRRRDPDRVGRHDLSRGGGCPRHGVRAITGCGSISVRLQRAR